MINLNINNIDICDNCLDKIFTILCPLQNKQEIEAVIDNTYGEIDDYLEDDFFDRRDALRKLPLSLWDSVIEYAKQLNKLDLVEEIEKLLNYDDLIEDI